MAAIGLETFSALFARLIGDRERTLGLVSLGLAVVLGLQASALVWTIAAPIGPVGAPRLEQPSTTRASFDPEALLRFDPFHRVAREAGPAAVDVSQLGLTLFALRAGGPDGGAAIIQIPGRGQRSISIGEEVAPGVVVKEIATDFAVLERGGATFQLGFPNTGGVVAQAAPAATVGPTGDAMLRVAATIEPAALMAELALQARLEDGEVTGYTLRGDRAGPVMQRLGLQPGDVLLEVNNHRLLDDERVAELQTELMSRPEAVIRYERNGEVKTATVRIAQP